MSKDILNRLHQHQRTSSNLGSRGEVVSLFEVEIDTCDRVPAESLLKVMLTEFDSSVDSRRTVCGIRYVYGPPIDRIVPDHETLYEQGLPRQLRTPVQPHPQRVSLDASSSPIKPSAPAEVVAFMKKHSIHPGPWKVLSVLHPKKWTSWTLYWDPSEKGGRRGGRCSLTTTPSP